MQALGVTIVKELGRGTSGVVYKVQSTFDGSFKVVKTIDLSSLSYTKQRQAEKEVSLLRQVNHPHIIKYYNSISQDNILYILMEYAPGGDLQTYISSSKQKHQFVGENQVWTWTYEISLALLYLHNHKIVHRDIKCLNIFLDSKNRIKIGDLGLSEKMSEPIESMSIGTPLFMSPELIRKQPYGLAVDIWALGCVVYTLCCFEAPFSGDNLITLGHNIANATPKPLPPRYSPGLQSFVSSLLEKDQKSRPKILGILSLIPGSVKNRYKKPVESIKIAPVNFEKLPSFSPNKVVAQAAAKEIVHGFNISTRLFNVKESPELPRTFSRNLRVSRSKTTISDLYNA